MNALDPGERAAITLALRIPVHQILMDDVDGRIEAERRKLKVTGTLGLVVEAHRRGLLDFEMAISRLAKTSFYFSPRLLAMLRKVVSSGGAASDS